MPLMMKPLKFTCAEYEADMLDELINEHCLRYCRAWYERGNKEKPFEKWRHGVRFKLWARMVSVGGLYIKDEEKGYLCNI